MNKRIVFLAAAVVLLGAAAWLMPSLNPAAVTPEGQTAAAPLQFPTAQSPADEAKNAARKTLDVTPVTPTPANAGAPAPAPVPANPNVANMAGRRDALLVALPENATDVVVMEADTFLNRPIIQAVATCFAMHDETIPLDALGLHSQDLDRVALVDVDADSSLTVVSGSVGKVDVTRLIKNPTESRYGDHGRVFEAHEVGDPAQGSKNKWVVARWQDTLVIVGRPRVVVEQAIDRLEGRASSSPLFTEKNIYGDAYGRMSARTVRKLFPEAMAAQVEEAGVLADFHVNAKSDVLLVADARGKSGLTQDVGKAIAASLAARRVQAASESDKSMVKLLDMFRVSMTNEGFRLQAGFTEKYLRSQLGACLDAAKKP